MNQISIAICDADSAYGNKLAEYLLETGNVAKAEVYTDWNSVEADLNEEKRDIWLINSGLLKEAETLPLKKEMVCLAEERLGAREAALPHIYKYSLPMSSCRKCMHYWRSVQRKSVCGEAGRVVP